MGRVFHRAANRCPEVTGLVDSETDVRYTYRTWYEKSCQLASALSAHGIDQGDRVATAMRNRVELTTLYCATQLLGAVFVPYKFRLSTEELTHLVSCTEPDILFFSDEVVDVIDATNDWLSERLDLVTVDGVHPYALQYDSFAANDDIDSFTPTFVDGNRTSIILHTSGTTGTPKAVPRTHENTYTAGMAHVIQNAWTSSESTLGMMSLSHTMGITTLAAIFLLNGKCVIQRKFAVDAVLDLVESERLTSLYLVPTVYHDLFESEAAATTDFSSVRHVTYASASMNPSTIETIEDHVDPETFVNHYGSTEVYTHSVCDSVGEHLNCVGRAGINAIVRVVERTDDEQRDPDATVGPEQLGEVIVDMTSPEAFDGYLSDDNGHSIVNGWFFTGDLGYRNEDGDLYLIGRADDMIISGGENIYPVEVERVLESYDLVDKAAVVGRASERWSQTVTAFVTMTMDPSEVDFGTAADALDEYCRTSDELADFKRPRKYIFIDKFTKNYIGKILRKELQQSDPDIEIYGEIDV